MCAGGPPKPMHPMPPPLAQHGAGRRLHRPGSDAAARRRYLMRAAAIAQAEPLDLAVQRARQVVDELDDVRVLVAAQALLAPRAQLVGERVVAGSPSVALDVGGDPARVVDRDPDDADAAHARMGDEHVLHVDRRHPQAADLEHVVRRAPRTT